MADSLHICDVEVFLAQPPETKVGRLACAIDLRHLGAQYGPVVRHDGGEHAEHAHHQAEDGELQLRLLLHGAGGEFHSGMEQVLGVGCAEKDPLIVPPSDQLPVTGSAPARSTATSHRGLLTLPGICVSVVRKGVN